MRGKISVFMRKGPYIKGEWNGKGMLNRSISMGVPKWEWGQAIGDLDTAKEEYIWF